MQPITISCCCHPEIIVANQYVRRLPTVFGSCDLIAISWHMAHSPSCPTKARSPSRSSARPPDTATRYACIGGGGVGRDRSGGLAAGHEYICRRFRCRCGERCRPTIRKSLLHHRSGLAWPWRLVCQIASGRSLTLRTWLTRGKRRATLRQDEGVPY